MPQNGIVVFSGGSAANTITDVFKTLAEDKQAPLSYIIPISDNGGSSSELIRVFGGPGIGMLGAGRLVRLIPEDSKDTEKAAIKALFNHRLPSTPVAARLEWLDIVEARHSLWTPISSEKRELIRSFFNTINLEIVKRTRPSSVFDFQSASVGNLFLTAARLFTGSFESAIYLLRAITGVEKGVEVIPAINSNFSYHISAGLGDGSVIVGQNAISHPSAVTTIPPESEDMSPATQTTTIFNELLASDKVEDANLPGSLPTLRKQYISFAKDTTEDLPARIERIWYINPYGQEIRPMPNPKVLEALQDAEAVIYSIGSLYTSIMPCLVLKDVGAAIAARNVRYKILILNGSLDRETGPSATPFVASDFIKAIADGCASSSDIKEEVGSESWSRYVTHVVHLEGQGTPRVDKHELKKLGIEPVRLYGRKNINGGMIYDAKALTQALEAIVGGRDPRIEPSRRNTLQHEFKGI